MTEPIEPNIFKAIYITSGKVYGCSELLKFVSKNQKIQIFVKFLKSSKKIIKSTKFFLLLFYIAQRENAHR